ncbi:hypothetical protein G7B13_29740, partial [Klebsiella pneumoniae]|nr:hypothetical protein [Klebsiella pneumoniae]
TGCAEGRQGISLLVKQRREMTQRDILNTHATGEAASRPSARRLAPNPGPATGCAEGRQGISLLVKQRREMTQRDILNTHATGE